MQLWQWQDSDADRLDSEGKKELAARWRKSAKTLASPEAAAAAADLAQSQSEPHWEVFYRHLAAQLGLFQHPRHLDFIHAQCDRIEALAGEAEKAGWPEYFCGIEDACTTLLLEDRPGNAAEVERRAEEITFKIPGGRECRFCFQGLRADALIEVGRLPEAETICGGIAKSKGVSDNHWFSAMLYWCDAALRAGDRGAAGLLVDGMRERLDGGTKVNPDNVWSFKLREARLALMDSDADAAAKTAVGIPPGSADAIQIQLSLAQYFAGRGEWKESRAAAERAAAPSLERGLTRFAAESCLLSAEASAKLGQDGGERAKQLGALLPKLGTRDLDERARALK